MPPPNPLVLGFLGLFAILFVNLSMHKIEEGHIGVYYRYALFNRRMTVKAS